MCADECECECEGESVGGWLHVALLLFTCREVLFTSLIVGKGHLPTAHSLQILP